MRPKAFSALLQSSQAIPPAWDLRYIFILYAKRLRGLLGECGDYGTHKSYCGVLHANSGCTCGLTDIRARIDAELQQETK
jgi:hypothetical protein